MNCLVITEYNNLAGTCRRSEKNTPEKQPPTKPIASDKTDWTKTKIDAQKKTQGADAVNAENLKKIDTEIAKTSNDLAEQRKKLEADAARNAANQAAVAKTIPHEATIIPRAKYPPLPDSGMEIDDLRHRTLDDLRHRGSFCYESPDGYACDCCRFRIATYSFRNMNVGQCYDSHWLGIEFITEPGFFEDQVTWRPNPALGQVLNRRIEVICLKDRNTFLSEHPN